MVLNWTSLEIRVLNFKEGIMNIICLRKWFFLSVVLGLIVPHVSLAMSSTKGVDKRSTTTELEHYFWYDGDEKRSVWVNPELIAEFNVQTEKNTQLSASDVTKKANTQAVFVRFLNIGEEGVTTQRIEKGINQNNNTRISPVLHDVASTSGVKKALPGNVLVQMKPDWSQEKINSWFEGHGLTAIKSLTFAPNTFLIQTKPGLDAIDTANRIYETGDVILSSPNWWQERVAR